MIEQGLVVPVFKDIVEYHPQMSQLIRGALERIPICSMAPHTRQQFLDTSFDQLAMEVEQNLLVDAVK